ncbi:taste receptor type 2 member 40-like [Pezoporus flaviventris]|uniref:taste receptor type 2 member 40-like n=1 Tax=Pezoporus flaviventris TaxID=889875 RepID=UPI002AB07455|nr:taste receptor type 2 member 40-like [Pezoporus flaviventris]
MNLCYSQEEFNVTSYDTLAIVIITFQALAGTWINAFIISVICISWVKKKSFNSNEKVMLFLGCSRFAYLIVTWVYCLLAILYPTYFYVHPIPQVVVAVQSFLNSSNLWVSACLCVFYCVKVANFRYTFFLYLKVKIDRIVPWLLLASVLLSLVICITVYYVTDKAKCVHPNSTALENFWKMDVRMSEEFFPVFLISGFGFATAFMAVIFSVLLIFSLWRQKRKMQNNSMKELNMDAYIKAIKSILSIFIIYSFNFICLILTLIYATKKENTVSFLIFIFQYAFPSLHSLTLIFSNPKLENALLRTLPCVKCKVCKK